MSNAFILRFQEHCVAEHAPGTVAGTATKTRVGREQPDTDPAGTSQSILSRGTATFTRVATEQADADRASGASTLPRTPIEMGTKTATAVREMSDSDPGQQQNQVLRR